MPQPWKRRQASAFLNLLPLAFVSVGVLIGLAVAAVTNDTLGFVLAVVLAAAGLGISRAILRRRYDEEPSD